jgi:uncharacterized protein (DUF302 family)
MEHPVYGMTRELPAVPWQAAVERVQEALKTEGFGVLTRIDVHETLKARLGVEMSPYVILGACNPPLAHEALSRDFFLGLLLPCNVVVAGTPGGSLVSIARPSSMFRAVENEALTSMAQDVEERLQRVLERIQDSPGTGSP